jgi:hypothetical protein
MAERERLHNRREAELIDFEHGGCKYTATISRFSDGRVAEIFLNGSKESAIAELAQESAIVCSIALQHGCPLVVLLHALGGRDVGPLARALDLAGGAP